MPEISRFYGIIVKMIPVLHKSPTAPSLRDFRSRILQTKKRIRDHVNDLESFLSVFIIYAVQTLSPDCIMPGNNIPRPTSCEHISAPTDCPRFSHEAF